MKKIKLTVEVMGADFQRGKKRKCSKCPIALATVRAFEEAGYATKGVSVDYSGIDYDAKSGEKFYASLPKVFKDYILFFDVIPNSLKNLIITMQPLVKTITFEHLK